MEDDITSYLDALKRDECYRVARVLKEAPHETTEIVYFAGANDAELGPFVRKRIKREACMGAAYAELLAAQRAGARFRHLPRIEDCYERDDELVVIMEFVRGETLHEVVYRRDPSLDLAREVFPQLCDAVVELHEGFDPPIIHRDLKPGNVILSKGCLTLIDFGIARAWREGAEADTASFGTRAYAPPEQFGYGQTDVRSDVYALGMVLYYLLTEEVPSPRLAGEGFAAPAVPVPLRAVLSRATAFDPAARYRSARDLRAAFEAACAQADAAGGRASGGGAEDARVMPTVGTATAMAIAHAAPELVPAEVPAMPGVSAAAMPVPGGPASPAAASAAPPAALETPGRRALGFARIAIAGFLWVGLLLSGISIGVDPKPGDSLGAYAPSVRWIGVISIQLIFTALLYPLAGRGQLARILRRPMPRAGRTALVLTSAGFGLYALMMALNAALV